MDLLEDPDNPKSIDPYYIGSGLDSGYDDYELTSQQKSMMMMIIIIIIMVVMMMMS